MIQSNDEPKTLLLLTNNTITTLLKEIKTIRFDITNGEGLWNEKPKEGNFMLYFIADGKVTDIDQLNKLYHLFTGTLDMLTDLNSIKAAKRL
jgi:hypothetical protein